MVKRNEIEITNTEIRHKKLPRSFDGYRIVQVSDLHDSQFGEGQKDLLDKIRKAAPDMIALTGDFIGEKDSDWRKMLRFMNELPAIAPCFYITGNHEYRLSEEDLKNFLKGIEDCGVCVLGNRTVRVQRDEEDIQIVGVDDPAKVGEGHRPMDENQMRKELREADFDREQFNLLLTHRPELLNIYAEEGADVVLCGHSHGGQLRLPLIGAFYVPSQGWFPKYDCGLFEEKGTKMYISRGLGCSVEIGRASCRERV